MAKFSPLDAVLAGLRFVRSRPATLLIWSAYLLVVMTVAGMAFLELGGDQMLSLAAATQGPAPDLRRVAGLMQDLLPAVGFVMLLIIVFGAVLVTAVLRVYLALGQHSWGGLRLGGEELRVLGVSVLMALTVLSADVLVNLVAELVAYQFNAPPAAIILVGDVLIAALTVRLSLAPVISMIEDRVSLRRSWLMTGKAFWRLLGAYLLIAGLMVVILALAMMVVGALMTAAAAATGGGVGQLLFALRHDYQEVNPLILALNVLMNLALVWICVVFVTVTLAVGVEAYRVLASETKGK
jgi:hypothetical protein